MIVRGKIKLVVCKEASGPMIMGFLKPLVLPDGEFSRDELRLILRHELIH